MSGQRILVVEDHEPLLSAIQGILETEEFIVSTATDGTAALQAMEENRPDLILTDILMPKMDGYVFYETLQNHPEWASIPVIFLTAKAEKEDVLKGISLGVEDYITKPFDSHELVAAVRSALEPAQDD
jgi:CheY-like chemotaxis protein